MKRSLWMFAAAVALPFSAVQAQGSRASESDSTESRSTARSGLGLGVGMGFGLMSLHSDDADNSPSANWCGANCRVVRRSGSASLMHSASSFFGIESFGDDWEGNGNSAAALMLAGNGATSNGNASGVALSNLQRLAARSGHDMSADEGTGSQSNPGAGIGMASRTTSSANRTMSTGASLSVSAGNGDDGSIPVETCAMGVCASDAAVVFHGEGEGTGIDIVGSFSQQNGPLNDGQIGRIVNPEPGTVALTLFGLGALAVVHRRRSASR